MERMIPIGFGNMVNAAKIIGVVKPEASPVRRMVQNAKDTERCLDATCGRKCKSVIVTENGMIVLSALLPETIAGRVNEHLEQ
ncbi:MAG: DUF370 domain-containing protein [Lachnospiraceae bacterium]|nr:DUF370 domain-containing protein [Lachnospiraceae bacterium]